jgi:hypothetical protein
VLSVRVNAGTPNEGTATAFTYDVDGREYLITAKHVVQGLRDDDKIDIFIHNDWRPIRVKIFRCDDPIDIAVLIPPYQLTVNFPLTNEGSFQFGQDAYFIGFPYGMRNSLLGMNGPYPLALIKRGTISTLVPIDVGKKASMILLDGYNNPGFSGGPIVFRDFHESGFVLRVVGVVHGFYPEVVPTMKPRDIAQPADASAEAKSQPWRVQQRKDGSWFEYIDSGEFVALNTGIVQGFILQPAIDLIRQHPTGPEVKELPGNDPGEHTDLITH